MLVCSARMQGMLGGLWGGSGHWGRAQWHTFVLLQRGVVLLLAYVWGGVVCSRCFERGCPTTRLLGESGGVCGWGDLRPLPAHD